MGRRARTGRKGASLAPVLALLASLLAIDQLVLFTGLADNSREAVERFQTAWQAPYDAYRTAMDPGRPQLVVVGSSRAAYIGLSAFEDAVRAAGLPHQAVNLGIAGGSTTLEWLALEHLTPLTTTWSRGSRLLFLISELDFTYFRPMELASFAGGRAVLDALPDGKDAAVDAPVQELAPALAGLYRYSGLTRLAVKQNLLYPQWAKTLQAARFAPAVHFWGQAKPADPSCQPVDEVFRPEAFAYFDRFAQQFGPDMVVAIAPVHRQRAACEAEMNARMLDFLRQSRTRWSFTLVEGHDWVTLPDNAWSKDPTHLMDDWARAAVARAAVELVK